MVSMGNILAEHVSSLMLVVVGKLRFTQRNQKR